MSRIRIAVIGAGQFGQNHMRVVSQSERAELAAVVDVNAERASQAAERFGCPALAIGELAGRADAAIIAAPTVAHAPLGLQLLDVGLDLLVEKPIASSLADAHSLTEAAAARSRVLQVGHLERFNPAVAALSRSITLPLFFEVHRMSVFTARSLDVDVVLDLMIHDLDIILSMVGQMPEEIRAAGISILSRKVDIANVRLLFPSGCVANLTASRVSTERIRKLRLFQPRQYISLDYARQQAAVFEVGDGSRIGFRELAVSQDEPLRLELEAFFDAIQTRRPPVVGGGDGSRALEVALAILGKIEEHSRRVEGTLAAWKS